MAGERIWGETPASGSAAWAAPFLHLRRFALMPRYFFILFLFMTFVARGSEWDLHRHAGRDYVSLENVADFYGLKSPLEETVMPASHSRQRGLFNARADINVTVGSREVMINGVRQWFSFPVREEGGKTLISRIDLAKTIEPMLRPQLISNLRPVRTVVLDPGHGGHDRGAVNKMGEEKTYTLDVARRLRRILEEQGVRVVMTRDSDVFVPLEQRAKVANAIPDSIFVSIHFNSGGAHANGFEVFSLTPRGAPSTGDTVLRPRDFREEPGNHVDVPSAALAASVYHSMLGHFVDFDRGLKRARFAVIRLSQVPSILVEGGFISNKEDAASIHNSEWREYLAGAIAKGVVGYKGLSELGVAPELVADFRKGGYNVPVGLWVSTQEGEEAQRGEGGKGESPPTQPGKGDGGEPSAEKSEEAGEPEALKDAKRKMLKPLLYVAGRAGPPGVVEAVKAGEALWSALQDGEPLVESLLCRFGLHRPCATGEGHCSA